MGLDHHSVTLCCLVERPSSPRTIMLGFDSFHVLQLMSLLLILGKADGGRLYAGVGKAVLMVDQQVTG